MIVSADTCALLRNISVFSAKKKKKHLMRNAKRPPISLDRAATQYMLRKVKSPREGTHHVSAHYSRGNEDPSMGRP